MTRETNRDRDREPEAGETPRDLAGLTLEPSLLWTGERFESGQRLRIGEDGRIAGIGPTEGPGSQGLERWPHRAILPGFVNAHSHAFQRGLRGDGETFPVGAGSFWTWREAMYRLVQELDEASLRRLCVQAFREMRAAGITAVGEFHYLHHLDADARDYRFDEVVLDAAAEVGLRLTLLHAFYAKGGVERSLADGQERFAVEDVQELRERLDHLETMLDANAERDADGVALRPLQSLGVVAHSLRAVSLEDVELLYAEARRRDLPFHMHVAEQVREVEEVRSAYGVGPLELLLAELDVSPTLTAVHCTHSPIDVLSRFVTAGGSVCVCPLTEANLGDGLPALTPEDDPDEPCRAAFRLCLGTDSNARISMLEEMRWLEYGQRLRTQSRGVLREEDGSIARTLLEAATEGGARALGLDAGELLAGNHADLVAIDLTHPSLEDVEPDHLLPALIFGAGNEVIAGTAVGGRWVG